MTDITNEGNKRDLGTRHLRCTARRGPFQRNAVVRRSEVTSEGCRPGWGARMRFSS